MAGTLVMRIFQNKSTQILTDLKPLSRTINADLGRQCEEFALMLQKYLRHVSVIPFHFPKAMRTLNPIQDRIKKLQVKFKRSEESRFFAALHAASELFYWHRPLQHLDFVYATTDAVNALLFKIKRYQDPSVQQRAWIELLGSFLTAFSSYAEDLLRIMPAEWITADYGRTFVRRTIVDDIADLSRYLDEARRRVCVENNANETMILVENANPKTSVLICDCQNSTIRVQKQPMAVYLQHCTLCYILINNARKSVSIDYCFNITLHITGFVGRLFLTDSMGCTVQLSERSANIEIIVKNSRNIRFMVPDRSGSFSEHVVDDTMNTAVKGTVVDLEEAEHPDSTFFTNVLRVHVAVQRQGGVLNRRH